MKLNVFHALGGEDFHNWRLTFQPDTENVLSCVHVPIMVRATVAAFPASYSKRAHTFRTAGRNSPAARARLGSPSFIDLNVNSPVPAGFVAELLTQYPPTRIQDRLCHSGFCELRGTDVPDDDQGVFPNNTGSRLVKLMFAGIGDLGMDRPGASFVSGTLGYTQSHLVSAIVPQSGDCAAIAKCGKRLEAEIDADPAISGWQTFGDPTPETDIPAPARVLNKASIPEILGDIAGFPEMELALEVGAVRSVNLHGARNKRYPTDGALCPEAGAESWALALGVSRDGKLTANSGDGIGVKAKLCRASGAELDQIEGAWPPSNPARFPPVLSFTLDLATKIPDLICCIGMPVEMLRDGRVFDAKFECQYHP